MGFCIIKYTEGYMTFPIYGGTSIPSFRTFSRSVVTVVPTPYEFWTPAHQNAIVPLYLCLAFAWGLEM
jgi:hypothetical protein